MINWFHRLFNPHCLHCIELDEDKFQKSLYCQSCESLKNENAYLREQNKLLLDKIVNPTIPSEPVINTDDLQPIQPMRKPFSVIRNELERADRLKAKEIDDRLKQQIAKPDTSPITNDEGVVDISKVTKELENIDKEIANG